MRLFKPWPPEKTRPSSHDAPERRSRAGREYLAKMATAIRNPLREVQPEECRPEEGIHASLDTTIHEQTGKKMEGLAFNYDGKWGLDSQVVFDELGFSYGFSLRPGDVGNNVGSSRMIEQAFCEMKFEDEKYLSGATVECLNELYLELKDVL
jgi:hypothetical protein